VWFRQDLRLHDNPALVEAAKWAQRRGGSVVCVYVNSPDEDGDSLLEGSRCGQRRDARMHACTHAAAACLGVLLLGLQSWLCCCGLFWSVAGWISCEAPVLALACHMTLMLKLAPLAAVLVCFCLCAVAMSCMCSWRPGAASLLWVECALQSLSADLVSRYGQGAALVFKQGPYLQALSGVSVSIRGPCHQPLGSPCHRRLPVEQRAALAVETLHAGCRPDCLSAPSAACQALLILCLPVCLSRVTLLSGGCCCQSWCGVLQQQI
jgi:hypothetical protein